MDKREGSAAGKITEIRALFEAEGETAPFLEELFTFLGDLIPIMARTTSMLEDTASAMPSVSDSITHADMMAEDAAHTIMDHVEEISTGLEQLAETQSGGKMKASLQELGEKVIAIQAALQFQDITSQHLRQATQILEAIQGRTRKLFQSLQDISEQNELVKNVLKAFIPESTEEALDVSDTIRQDSSISQDDIDALFSS